MRPERVQELIRKWHYERDDVTDIVVSAVQAHIRRLDAIEYAARCPDCGSILSSDGLCDICLMDEPKK